MSPDWQWYVPQSVSLAGSINPVSYMFYGVLAVFIACHLCKLLYVMYNNNRCSTGKSSSNTHGMTSHSVLYIISKQHRVRQQYLVCQQLIASRGSTMSDGSTITPTEAYPVGVLGLYIGPRYASSKVKYLNLQKETNLRPAHQPIKRPHFSM